MAARLTFGRRVARGKKRAGCLPPDTCAATGQFQALAICRETSGSERKSASISVAGIGLKYSHP